MSDPNPELQDAPAENLLSMSPHPKSSFSNRDSLREDTPYDAQKFLGNNEDLLSQSSVNMTNAQGNTKNLERDVENNTLDPPKFFFGTLQDFSDIISELQISLSRAKNLHSTSPHPKSHLEHQDPSQEEAPCGVHSYLHDDEELPSQNSVETNNAQDSDESLEGATKNSSGAPKCYFGDLEDVSDFIMGLSVSASPAEDLFPPSPHSELSFLSRDSPQEDATCTAENSLSDDEELSLLSSVEINDVQGNAESLEGLKDTKNSFFGSPQFHFGAVQTMSDSITEVQDSCSSAIDVLSASHHLKSSLSSLDSLQEDLSCSAENSLGDDEELSLSSVEMNDVQGNAESLEGLKDTKNSFFGSPQFHFGAVQTMSDSITEVQDSCSSAIDVLSASPYPKSSLSSLDSLQEEDLSCSAESCLGEREALLFQSSVGSNITNNVGKLAELSILFENSVPLNLFQDSWSSKLRTLPDRHRTALENLISQIGYQINYFTPKFKKKSKSSHMMLICKVCQKHWSVKGAVRHVNSQEHLGNLNQRCEKMGQTLVAGAIDAENWEFLDFEEISQRYHCSLCKVELSNSISSCYEHVQLDSHVSKLKAPNCKAPLYSVSAYSSASSSKCDNNGASSLKNISLNVNGTSSSTGQIKLKENTFRVVTELLSRKDKQTLKHVQDRLQDGINYFKPTYEDEQGRLFLICKVCKKSILLQNVISHVSSSAHSKSLKKNLSALYVTAGQNCVNGVKSTSGLLSNANKKIVEDLTHELKDFTTYFEPFENVSDELYFICKTCTMVLLPEEVRSHIKSCPALESSPETKLNKKSCTTVDPLNKADEKVIKKLKKKLWDNMKYFKPFYKNGSNELHFTCDVCSNKVLHPTNVRQHTYVLSHQNNVRKSLSDVKLEALSSSDKKTITRLLKYFHCQLYQLYVFQLKFDPRLNKLCLLCKVCNEVVIPKDVKTHVSSEKHSTNLLTNPFSLTFESLNECNKEIVKEVRDAIKDGIQAFNLVYKIGTEELRFNCKYCHQILVSQKVEDHVKNIHHLKAVSAQVSESSDTTDAPNFKIQISEYDVRNKATELPEVRVVFDSAANHLRTEEHQKDTIARNNPTLPPKVSSFLDSVAEGLQFEERQKQTGGEGSKHCMTPVSMKAEQCSSKGNVNSELFQKIEVTSNSVHSINDDSVSYASLNLQKSVLNPNVETVKDSIVGVLREQNNEALKSDLNHQIRVNNETCFKCLDCSFTCRFKAEENDGLKREVARRLFTTCRSRPVEILNDSNKESMNMLLEKIGRELKKFYFVLNSSDELCFKCKICRKMLPPESVEKHLNETHLEHTQPSDAFLVFENLSDGKKNMIKKLYGEICSNINNLDLTVSFNFVCKVCGANVSPETVANHDSSEEHLECSRGQRSENHVAGKILRNSQDVNSDILTHEKKMQDICGSGDSNRLPQNIHDQKLNILVDGSDTTVTASIIEQTLKFLDFEESSECYQCILCKKKLSNSSNSWIKHFKSTYHILKSSKPNIYLNSVNAFQSISGNKTANCSENVCEEVSRKGPKTRPCKVLRRVKYVLQDDAKYYEPSYKSRKLRFICKLCGECVSDAIRHHSDAHKNISEQTLSDVNLEAAQNKVDGLPFNFDPLLSSVTNRTSSVDEKVVESKETQADITVAVKSSPDTSPEYYRKEMQPNLSTGCNGKIAEAVVTDERNEFSASRSGSHDVMSSGIAQNNGHVTATYHRTASIPEFMCIIPNPHNQEYAIYLNNSKNEFKDFNSAAEVESEMSGINSVSCTVCRQDVITDDIANHVSSKKHAINLELSVNVYFKTLSDYYEEVVGMFTGNVNHGNNFEIFYELPLSELRFYCKLCNIMLSAESLENHVHHSRQNDLTEEFKASGTSRMYKVTEPDTETGGENQSSKQFFCKPCNHQLHIKDIADHVDAREHLKLLEIIGNFLDFDSFIAYKERVVATLSREPWKNPNDFEFFRNIRSSKLHLYCKPCKALLQPEFLNRHIRHTNHRHNSVVRCCSALFPEGSPRPEIVTHQIDSRIEQSGASDDDSSANISTSICSLM